MLNKMSQKPRKVQDTKHTFPRMDFAENIKVDHLRGYTFQF